ncbi:SCP2 sterol-binding domain-containing protein, partial [Melampsora americana]
CRFVIKNQSGVEASWYIDMKKTGRVGKGKAPIKPDVTIWCSDLDFVALAAGEANPQKLYAAGRIKVRGNMDRALKVEHVISHEREKIKLAGEAMNSSSRENSVLRSKL